MAVQKSKVSRSRRDMRRAHDGIRNTSTLSIDSTTGETHMRHHMTKTGFYRGKRIIEAKPVNESSNNNEE